MSFETCTRKPLAYLAWLTIRNRLELFGVYRIDLWVVQPLTASPTWTYMRDQT